MKKLNPTELKKWRLVLNVSQFQLSHLTGISRHRITLFECGYLDLKSDEKNLILNALKSEQAALQRQASDHITAMREGRL